MEVDASNLVVINPVLNSREAMSSASVFRFLKLMSCLQILIVKIKLWLAILSISVSNLRAITCSDHVLCRGNLKWIKIMVFCFVFFKGFSVVFLLVNHEVGRAFPYYSLFYG